MVTEAFLRSEEHLDQVNADPILEQKQQHSMR